MWKEILEKVARAQTLPHTTRDDVVLLKEAIDDIATLLTQVESTSAEEFVATVQNLQAHLEVILKDKKVGIFQRMGIGRMLKQLGRKAGELNTIDRRDFLKSAAAAAMAPYVKFKGPTVAHKTLDIEAPVLDGKVPAKCYQRLDRILARVGSKLKQFSQKYHQDPRRILTAITHSIQEEGIKNVPSQPFLSSGLLSGEFDCDCNTIVCAAAGERYGWPIYAAVWEKHMFVTWGTDRKIFWETTTSLSRAFQTMESQLAIWKQPRNILKVPCIMRPLTQDELLSLQYTSIAHTLQEKDATTSDTYTAKAVALGPKIIFNYYIRFDIMNVKFRQNGEIRKELLQLYDRALALDSSYVLERTKMISRYKAYYSSYRMSSATYKKISLEAMQQRVRGSVRKEFETAREKLIAGMRNPEDPEIWFELYLIEKLLGNDANAGRIKPKMKAPKNPAAFYVPT